MPIEIPKDERAELAKSMRAYFEDVLEVELGHLPSEMLVEFVIREVGPSVYNQAIRDAQAYLQDKLIDLDAVLFEEREPAPRDP